MTSTLELYRRIGNVTVKEKRKPIEETEQKPNTHYDCRIYTADGSEFIAKSVKPVHNACGYGYRIESEQFGIMFYKAREIVGIIPIKTLDKKSR